MLFKAIQEQKSAFSASNVFINTASTRSSPLLVTLIFGQQVSTLKTMDLFPVFVGVESFSIFLQLSGGCIAAIKQCSYHLSQTNPHVMIVGLIPQVFTICFLFHFLCFILI